MAQMTIGFIGSGALTNANVRALLSDFYEAQEDAPVTILPVTRGNWGQGLDHVAEFLIKEDYPYEVIVDETTNEDNNLYGITKDADKSHVVQRVPNKLLNVLEKAESPQLIVVWDDEDADAVKAVDRALEVGIPTYDLTTGLLEMAIDDGIVMYEDQAEQFRESRTLAMKKAKTKERSVVARNKSMKKSNMVDAVIKGVMKNLDAHMQKLLAAIEPGSNGSAKGRVSK